MGARLRGGREDENVLAAPDLYRLSRVESNLARAHDCLSQRKKQLTNIREYETCETCF